MSKHILLFLYDACMRYLGHSYSCIRNNIAHSRTAALVFSIDCGVWTAELKYLYVCIHYWKTEYSCRWIIFLTVFHIPTGKLWFSLSVEANTDRKIRKHTEKLIFLSVHRAPDREIGYFYVGFVGTDRKIELPRTTGSNENLTWAWAALAFWGSPYRRPLTHPRYKNGALTLTLPLSPFSLPPPLSQLPPPPLFDAAPNSAPVRRS